MSCRICHRSSCTESFHSLEEQERFEKARTIGDDTHAIADLLAEIESLKAQIKERDEKIEELRSDIRIQEERIIDLEDMI